MSRLLHRIVSRRAEPDDAGAPRPSGAATVDESPRPRGGERGRARRRLRYLRQVRDVQLRDLGGFVLDLYRYGERRDHLVREKLDAIIASDKERQALEAALDDRRRIHEVRQPGVGGTCPRCGELHASGARFCARCGAALAARGEEGAQEEAGAAAAGPPEEAGWAVEDAPPAVASVPEEAPELRAVADAETVELAAVRERRRRAGS
jgi:hypothetical protein